jgi:4-amino-4-deoxy-L-arabinose transferase-like glycosyltransferase
VPVLAWYLHASTRLATGSRASAENAALWLHAISPVVWLRPETYPTILKGLAIRSFTPLGFGLAAWAIVAGKVDRLWTIWAVAAGSALALLAGKLHHDYYWLALAAPAAVGVARGIVAVSESAPKGRVLAGCLALMFGCLAAWQAAATWRTPPDWRALDLASTMIRRHVPTGVWLIAPEAVLYAADRRGCRLESGRSAIRAAGEWGATLGTEGAADEALVSFYIARGARYLADVGDPAAGPLRGPLHQSIRHSRQFQVLVDRPGLILAGPSRSVEANDGD